MTCPPSHVGLINAAQEAVLFLPTVVITQSVCVVKAAAKINHTAPVAIHRFWLILGSSGSCPVSTGCAQCVRTRHKWTVSLIHKKVSSGGVRAVSDEL